MTTTEPDQLAQLDREHIDKVAYHAALHLAHRPVAIALLAPGDRTLYEVILARVSENIVTDQPIAPRVRWDELDVAISPGGRPYRWIATNAPHLGYVAQHFVEPHGPGEHTAVVLTEFLQRLAGHYRDEATASAKSPF